MTEEANELFMTSLETLMESECSEFMVYKVVGDKFENLPGIDEWAEVVEIDTEAFTELHLNLCQKIGKKVRRG